MTTERLAALLIEHTKWDAVEGLSGYEGVRPDYATTAARLIAQGVRVGDPPPPADDAGGLRAALEALPRWAMVGGLTTRHLDVVSDGDLLRRDDVLALTAQPAPLALDRERSAGDLLFRLAQAIETYSNDQFREWPEYQEACAFVGAKADA